MRYFVLPLLFLYFALATPTRRDAWDYSTDVDQALAGTIACASNAAVFGGGTFDTGNLVVWVGPFCGPFWKESLLTAFNGDVHVQGVNPEVYSADLIGYVEGGSESRENGCARLIDDYVAACPEANIFVSEWGYV